MKCPRCKIAMLRLENSVIPNFKIGNCRDCRKRFAIKNNEVLFIKRQKNIFHRSSGTSEIKDFLVPVEID